MEGFTGIKDLDKELMLSMDDREFIQTCQLNTYFRNICKDDYLFKRRLEKIYPDVLEKLIYDRHGIYLTWKKYYSQVVKTVALLKEKYNFIYTKGDPFFQLTVFRNAYMGLNTFVYRTILHYGLLNFELSLIEYAIKQDSTIIGRNQLEHAAGFNDPVILKYLIEHGGDVNLLRGLNFNKFSPASIQYLKSLGVEN